MCILLSPALSVDTHLRTALVRLEWLLLKFEATAIVEGIVL